MDKFKPCPWGCTVKHGLTKGQRDRHGDLNQNYAVWCKHSHLTAADQDRLVEDWNTRTAPTVQEAAKVLLSMGGLPSGEPVEAFHRQIDWCRDDQKTNKPYDPSQVSGGGTSCAEDIQDAWEAALRALSEEPQ